MNKKIIALIIILLVIGVGIAILVINGNRKENTTTNSQSNNVNNNQNSEGEIDVNSGKALVLYFSMSGNTEVVANFIHDKVGGDIVKLETVKTYPSEYNDLIDYAQEEQRNDERPELKTEVVVADYDVIFLGYPNWWGDMPMALYTFLDTYDLAGKTIAPFITHGGSGLSGTPDKIKALEPDATVTDGLAISGSSATSSESTVNDWLEQLGY